MYIFVCVGLAAGKVLQQSVYINVEAWVNKQTASPEASAYYLMILKLPELAP